MAERTKKMYRGIFAVFLAYLVLMLGANIANAADCTGAGGFVPLECFQGSAKLEGAYNETELGPFLQRVFVGALSLGAILAVLRLAWGGFLYMSSDLWSKKDMAKDIIQDALFGLLLLLAIWLILNQINPDILKLKIDTRTPQTNTNGAIVGGQRN